MPPSRLKIKQASNQWNTLTPSLQSKGYFYNECESNCFLKDRDQNTECFSNHCLEMFLLSCDFCHQRCVSCENFTICTL